jgi:hypothetical protein
MKTMSTTQMSAAAQIPNQAAPVRVCGTRVVVGDVDGGAAEGFGDAVAAESTGAP